MRTIILSLAAVLACAASAHAQGGEYTHCDKAGDAILLDVSVATCDEARALATSLVPVAPTGVEAALVAAGWTPLRAAATGFQNSYDLIATRGLATVLIRRPGDAPDLDGWMAGRELVFARAELIPGAPAPNGAAVCTSGFLIRLGTHPGGLSAGHCAGVTRKGVTRRRNAALRRPPQPGIVLGSVQRNIFRRPRRLDALVLPVPSGAGRPSAAVVERGLFSPPWFVRGTARPLLGRRVCFTGRTSGADQCGKIVRSFPGTRLPCTTISAREGDSGGPVYTAPAPDGTVRAVGITTLVFGPLQSMCFTAIGPVLDALDAELVTVAPSA
ncbi:MAG TPA: hypothetical protein VNA28_08175 [Solirubrobacteraceae bacterium]|nr:hypothetical protein [Solirubrobacteraceae bacterium]